MLGKQRRLSAYVKKKDQIRDNFGSKDMIVCRKEGLNKLDRVLVIVLNSIVFIVR